MGYPEENPALLGHRLMHDAHMLLVQAANYKSYTKHKIFYCYSKRRFHELWKLMLLACYRLCK